MQKGLPDSPYRFVESPNCNDRPPGTLVDVLVLHSTVIDTLQETVDLFLDPKEEKSAHFVVGRDGEVVQMVAVERRAWHAGQSELAGVPRVNDYSIGIEMVNLNDGNDPYPDAQYESVAGILRWLRTRFDIPDERIVSHTEIARPPGRKNDPRGFDFDRLRRMAHTG